MAETEREVLVDVRDLQITYGSGRKKFTAVKKANFQIYKGETFGLVGESGSGKTTIGRAIMRIIPTSGGDIIYDGQKINGHISRELDRKVIQEIQMIFQDPQASLNERAKVSYIVGEGLMNVRKDLTPAQREEKIRQMEVVRHQIGELHVAVPEGAIHFTATVGAASVGEEKGIEDLIALADSRMYYGKQHGKDCMVFAHDKWRLDE